MATWTKETKNASTFVNKDRSDTLSFLLTDALDYILVGQNSNEVLTLWEDVVWNNQVKN